MGCSEPQPGRSDIKPDKSEPYGRAIARLLTASPKHSVEKMPNQAGLRQRCGALGEAGNVWSDVPLSRIESNGYKIELSNCSTSKVSDRQSGDQVRL
jgi:hypothetical protein